MHSILSECVYTHRCMYMVAFLHLCNTYCVVVQFTFSQFEIITLCRPCVWSAAADYWALLTYISGKALLHVGGTTLQCVVAHDQGLHAHGVDPKL